VKELEKIIQRYPKELEAKTFLVFQIWENEGKGIPVTSRETVDALIQQVLEVTPCILFIMRAFTFGITNRMNMRLNQRLVAAIGPGNCHMWHCLGYLQSTETVR
jgi:hypothetical protein